MKIRNRKLVSGVIAAFMAVLMTGVVFAFVAQGPLTFTGTANVDASLALAIVASDYQAVNGATAELGLSEYVVATNASGYRTAAMTAAFDGLEQSAVFSFTVANIGTIAAEIAPIALEFAPDSSERLVWTQAGALETFGEILLPGEEVQFSFTVAFDAEGFLGWYYIAEAGVSFVLSYGLVGSYEPYVPGPAYVAVEDILLSISAGPASNPQTRVWTSIGTQGWEINPVPMLEGGFNMSRARLTENQNHWNRSTQGQGRDAEDTVNIPRPGVAGVNPLATGLVGLFRDGLPANQTNDRYATFSLTITLVDGTEVVIAGVYEWQDNNRGNVGTGRLEFTTFKCETGRFELALRGNGNNFEEWWLVDTSGVN